jgi:uncharacterized membrane protein YeiH
MLISYGIFEIPVAASSSFVASSFVGFVTRIAFTKLQLQLPNFELEIDEIHRL